MVLEGKKNIEIARELGINHKTVGRDLAAMARMNDVVNLKAMELERLNQIEAKMWEAWEASISEGKKHHFQCASFEVTIEADPNPKPILGHLSLVTEEGHGDAVYMQMILQISDMRYKLLRLYGPIKIPVNPNYAPSLTQEERAQGVEVASEASLRRKQGC